MKYKMNDKLEFGVNAFYIRKHNIVGTLRNKGEILDDGTVLDRAVRGQFGTMDSRGFDMDVTYKPFRSFMLSAGYSYTNARTREVNGNKYLSADAANGTQFIHIPENTLFAFANYSFYKTFLKGLTVNLSVNYMDEVYYNLPAELKTPKYWISDLSLAYRFKKHFTIGVNINNLFDAKYFTEPSTQWQLIPGMPRNYQVSVSYSL